MQTMDRPHHPMMSPPPINPYAQEHRSYAPPPPTIQNYHHHNSSPIAMPSPPNQTSLSRSPVSSPTSSFQPSQPKRRRVPTEERKRTAMSCDRCKSRKIKVGLCSKTANISASIRVLGHVRTV